MADRKVSVALELKAGQFKTEAKSAERSVENLSDKVEELDRDITKIPPDAAKAGASLRLLGSEADSAARRLDGIGDKGTKLAVLDSQIRSTRTEVRKLADEFTKTGDVDVFKRLGDAQGRLGTLMKIRKSVSQSIELGVEDAATSPGFAQVAQKIGIGLAAGMAVPLVAALGGAVTGGVGFGVAGLGLLGAVLGDPQRFAYAWGQSLRDIKNQFINASDPFKNELYNAIAGIGPLVRSWHIDDILRNAAKYVQPLTKGLEGFASHIVAGVGTLVEKGGPAVDALSQSLDRIGLAGERAMNSISDGAQGGAYALHDTANAVSLVIEGFGVLIGKAEEFYEFNRDHPFQAAAITLGLSVPIAVFAHTVGEADGVTRQLTTTQYGLTQAAIAAGHAFSAQGDDLTALSQQLNAAKVNADTLAASMVSKIFSATMNLDQGVLGVAESLTRLDDALKKNGRELDIHKEKGQANREAILGAVTANMQLYQSQIAAGMSAEDAAKSYDENTAALEKQLQKAHFTQGEIDNLIGKYRNVPGKVNTEIAINGLTAAITGLSELIKQINGIHDKTVTIYYKTQGQSRNAPLARGGIRHAATGMIVPPSNPGTLIGEPQTGGEALIPLRGITQGRAQSLAQTAVAGYGLAVVPRQGGGSGMPSELTLHATFIDPSTGQTTRQQTIRWSLDHGRDPATATAR